MSTTVDDQECHVKVVFDGILTMHFRAPRIAAELYAAEFGARIDAHVTIDDQVDPDMPVMPSQCLYE